MPSRTHDLFSQFMSDAMIDALSELGRNDNAVRPLTSKIVKGATSNVDIYVSDSDEKSNDHVPLKRSPDGQFLYADADLPNVVFEVAYSQDPKQLPKLAKGYIHHSWGDIKAVICFTISKSKESTISIWKPVFYPEADNDEVTMEIEQVVKSQAFRTADGTPINQDHKLVLDLHDFIPDTDCDGYSNPCISIPYSKLYESLLEAEQRSKPRRKCSSSKRGVKRSCLSSDSVESVAEEDRKQWKAKDRATRDKQDAKDGIIGNSTMNRDSVANRDSTTNKDSMMNRDLLNVHNMDVLAPSPLLWSWTLMKPRHLDFWDWIGFAN